MKREVYGSLNENTKVLYIVNHKAGNTSIGKKLQEQWKCKWIHRMIRLIKMISKMSAKNNNVETWSNSSLMNQKWLRIAIG